MQWSKLPKEHYPKSIWDFKKHFAHPVKRRLAKCYLVVLKRIFGLKVVAITGSAGKTTTKEMVHSILSKRGKTVASFKNIDPVYNIPTSILKCTPMTKFLVLEMGVEYPGEMDFYCWLAESDVGVITNIFPTHTEFFGSEEGVFGEKRKLVSYLGVKGVAVLNKDDKWLRKLRKHMGCRIVWFGKGADIDYERLVLNKNLGTEFVLKIGREKRKIEIPMAGEHFVYNALSAAAVGWEMGCLIKEIAEGLVEFTVPEHRMRLVKLKNGALVIDDSYNNNPFAAKKALETFGEVYKNERKGVVFGDMLELGKIEKKEHIKIGRILAEMKVSFVVGVGKAAENVVGEFVNQYKKGVGIKCKDWSEALDKTKTLLERNTVTLVKGSRSIGLDTLVSKL
jgi:UDP-N-acetylmuramoyl-tripeptide--D-alanyl-D-alanine ligase